MAEHSDPEPGQGMGLGPRPSMRPSPTWCTGVPALPLICAKACMHCQDKAECRRRCPPPPPEALTREWEEPRHRQVRAHHRPAKRWVPRSSIWPWLAKGKYAPRPHPDDGRRPRPTWRRPRANGTLFFPINPGQEEKSWERFFKEGIAQIHRRHVRGRIRSFAHRRVSRSSLPRHPALEEVDRQRKGSAT